MLTININNISLNKIKVLHICTSKFGGAGIAAFRLHNSLNQIVGDYVESYWLDKSMIIYPRLSLFQRIIKKVFKILCYEKYKKSKIKDEFEKYVLFSNLEGPLKNIQESYDIIHLHWITNFVDYNSFFKKNKIPLVWTCHDKNPFMGGFHYDLDKYKKKNNIFLSILDNYIIRQKKLLYSTSTLKSFIATTIDFKNIISNLFPNFRVDYIPLGFNVDIFKPRNNILCLNVLNIPFTDNITILFVAQNILDYRKGWDLLAKSFKLFDLQKSIRLIYVGDSYNSDLNINYLNIEFFNLGFITDDNVLSYVYNISNVLIMPSREEAFGQVMAESLLCGTPVIGFSTSGIIDFIINDFNGYIVKDKSPKSLHDIINKFILSYNDNIYDRFLISDHIKQYINNNLISLQHYEFYKSILKI